MMSPEAYGKLTMSHSMQANETYVVVETSYYYEGRTKRNLSKTPQGRAVVFSSFDEAQEHIDDYLDAVERCVGGKEWRPSSFEVKPVSRLPQYLAWQI